jgi:hypothetical protein
MNPSSPVLHRMIHLRFLVGALGERVRWWPSRFTDEIALRRFEFLFPRTPLRASLEALTVAARRDHDGKLHPDALHLFRLSGAQEDAIAHLFARGTPRLAPPPASLDAILAELDAIGAPDGSPAPQGPCSLGSAPRTRLHAAIADLARTYAAAARSDRSVTPYFEPAA